MASKVYVCQSSDCAGKGSANLLRDIEEMCVGSGVEVVAGSCLNHCGKGPNCEIQFSGKKAGKPKVVDGVKTFKAAEQLVKKELGVDVSKLHHHVAELKYEARRDPKHEVRMHKISSAFKVLGGEDSAARKEPRLAGELFVMRAREVVGTDAAAAQKDAELAVATVSDYAGGYTVLSLAQEAQQLWDSALESAKKAIDIAHGSDMKQAFQLQRRLEQKIKEIQLQEQKKREDEQKAKEAEELKRKAEEQSSRPKESKDSSKDPPGSVVAKAKARPGAARSPGAKAKARAQKKAAAKSTEAEAAKATPAEEDRAKAGAEVEEQARQEEELRQKAEEERIKAEQEAADREAKLAEAHEAETRARQMEEAKERLARELKARDQSREAFRARVKAEQERRQSTSWFACCAPERTEKTVVTCLEGHQLIPRVSAAPIHTCAVCYQQVPVNAMVYICAPCHYNECSACYLYKLKDDEGADAIQVATAESTD